jgi:hypothetical protein
VKAGCKGGRGGSGGAGGKGSTGVGGHSIGIAHLPPEDMQMPSGISDSDIQVGGHGLGAEATPIKIFK